MGAGTTSGIRWLGRARPARPADLAFLEELFARCSAETLYRRFHGAGEASMHQELRRVAYPSADHRSWVAADRGAVHGTATLAWGADGQVEAAFLVEDGWQRRGVGRALFRALAEEARFERLGHVVARLQAENLAATRFLLAVAPAARLVPVGWGEVEALLPVGPVAGRSSA